MQLDIFEHSRDVILRNAAIDALRNRDAAASAAAVAALAAEHAADPLLPQLALLLERLRLRVDTRLERAAAAAALQATEDAAQAAQRVFGAAAAAWLSPLWSELAQAMADLPFDPADETLHSVPLLLRAGESAEAGRRAERIASWRRQPAPLSWKLESELRLSGFNAAWPLFVELCWMAPKRAAALAPRLDASDLDRLTRQFDAQFESDAGADDFAWFPAWALVAQPGLAGATRLAQPGAGTTPERGAWQVLNLLLLERQGRHAEVIDGRRKLRAIGAPLFAFYMQSR